MNNARAILVLMFFSIGLLILGSKLYDIQINNHERYFDIAQRQQNRTEVVKPKRGMITDRLGNVLSFTKDDISFFVDVRMLNSKSEKKIAEKFSKTFGKKEGYYLKMMKEGRGNICLEDKVLGSKASKLNNFVVDGLYRTQDFTRVYPYKKLAAHILGFVDKDYKGAYGIEKTFDDFLKGEKGISHLERDVMGRTVSVDDKKSESVINGGTVRLTLNKNYQRILEEELKRGLEESQGESAVGIIMDPNTGEILSLSNLPNFNPAEYYNYSNDEIRNRALTDTYEPGSTFKPIVMAALLDKHLVRASQVINTENGYYRFKTAKIRDSHKFEKLTVREIIEYSSNIGMVKLASKIDDATFYRYLRNFGFGNMLGFDLPGETSGTLKKPKSFSGISKQFIAHGYEVSITPLQLMAAYGALINGGTLYKPFIVEQIEDDEGKIIKPYSSTKIRKVISKNTSEQIREFMYGVVEKGTAQKTKIADLEIGGKTGTTQVLVDGSYSNKRHNASFIGFFPVTHPKILCMILISSPKKGRYGGEVAAPIFKKIVEGLIKTNPELKSSGATNRNLTRFFTSLNEANKETEFANYAKDKIEKLDAKISSKKIMPNLTKMSKREAILILSQLGLKYKISGTGKVISQSIKPGKKIEEGLLCKIDCSSNKKLKNVRIN